MNEQEVDERNDAPDPHGVAADEAYPMELHIRATARRRYQVNEALFQSSGDVVFGNTAEVRKLAHAINDRRAAEGGGAEPIRAGQLYALGLIDEIMHYIVALYCRQVVPDAMAMCRKRIATALGADASEELLRTFSEEFPPRSVYLAGDDVSSYLDGATGGRSNREIALEELMLLGLTNENPASSAFAELFDDAPLRQSTPYAAALSAVDAHFAALPPFGPDQQTLLEMLRAPMRASPHSLAGQLRFMREKWGVLIAKFLDRMLLSSDLLAEEEAPRFGGPGPSRVLSFESLVEDAERFSEDRDWMPRVVLIAKSAYVWLSQLSAAYGRAIERLDQIPDEELDRLAGYGFNALWLIGLWERSRASREIKRMSGNPEALASAYAIEDYVIADALGGEAAFSQLKARAAQRGIRMAGDMVPNHMGLDSRWVMDHPDWFVQLDHPPFPSYRYTGVDLAPDRRAVVQIEDGYWNRSDAAVVYRWIDRGSGQTRYIYHGNDGTSMPWNDTAQLNFMRADVREAVIQTILHVARKFPVIRFDAAMILTKQHYSRLWFPPPGHGGAIPSRAGRGYAPDAFNEMFPVEFWREVVDRIAAEAPDTLLLAEAFWLLEGYFVRTLGMHRVYNSAFMNMLKDEENEKYRAVLKNVLAFNPRILERFVNFMNNPDEEPAAEQFGTSDKYFGVAMMLSTLPGLPMFGHGQLEGFREKYGMEYQRAYWEEAIDEGLVARHEREIVPLLKKRYLFSGVEHFTLFDVWRDGGGVEENLYAYSNRASGERALVLYNNRYQSSEGWVRWSVPIASPEGERGQRSLCEALGLRAEPGLWYRLYEYRSGLTFLRASEEIAQRGVFTSLGGYQYQIYTGFGELWDVDGRYSRLATQLGGGGVRDLEEELRWLELEPLVEAYGALCAEHPWSSDAQAGTAGEAEGDDATQGVSAGARDPDATARALARFFTAIERQAGSLGAGHGAERSAALLARIFPFRATLFEHVAHEEVRDWLAYSVSLFWPLVEWSAGRGATGAADLARWLLGRIAASAAERAVGRERAADAAVCGESLGAAMVIASRHLIATSNVAMPLVLARPLASQKPRLRALFVDPAVTTRLGLSWYGGVEWFNREATLELWRWVSSLAGVCALGAGPPSPSSVVDLSEAIVDRATELETLSDEVGYRYQGLVSRFSVPSTLTRNDPPPR